MNFDKKCMMLVQAAILLMLVSFAWGISASGAVNYIATQKHVLHSEEKYEQPNVRVENSGKTYWVIPVTLNDELSVLFAVDEAKGELVADKGTNRLLFRTGALLRSYTETKKKISIRSDVYWLATKEYSRILEGLSSSLLDEGSDLVIIRTSITNSQIREKISGMEGELASMNNKSLGAANAIDEALSFEAGFFTLAETSKYDELKNRLEKVFDLLSELDNEARDYQVNVSALKQMISMDNTLLPQEKDFFIKKADSPEGFERIGSYATTAVQLKDTIETMYANIQNNMDSYLSEFETRLERGKVYTLIYEENKKISSATGGAIIDLKSMKEYVLDKSRINDWKETESVAKLSSYYAKAEDYFNKRNYEKATEYANKAITEAATVYAGGLYSEDNPELLNIDTITKIIIALVAFLALLFAWNNKGKIMSALKGNENNKKGEDEGLRL